MSNNDYILRSDALNALSRGSGCENICSNAIKRIPAADVEPKRKTGHWIRVQWVEDEDWQEGGYWILRCSECVMPYHTPTPYCPHCGAKMDAEPPKEADNGNE